MDEPYTNQLAYNGPPFPDLIWMLIFENLNPQMLLTIRRVSSDWKRLAEANALTRKHLTLLYGTCESRCPTQACTAKLILRCRTHKPYDNHGINPDGSPIDLCGRQVKRTIDATSLTCRTFSGEDASLLLTLFPSISHFTVAHNNIHPEAVFHLCTLLTGWSGSLETFAFFSYYALIPHCTEGTTNQSQALHSGQEGEDESEQLPESTIDRYLTSLFGQLNGLPKLKRLYLGYKNGTIRSAITDFAFLSRLEELHLGRTDLEVNLEAACRRYLNSAGSPSPIKLRRFTSIARHPRDVRSATRFINYLRTDPAAHALASATTWNYSHMYISTLQAERLTRHRYPHLRVFDLRHLPLGTSLGRLTGDLSKCTPELQVLILGLHDVPIETVETEKSEQSIVPLKTLRGLEVYLYQTEHSRVPALLDQLKTAFPGLYSLSLHDLRPRCEACPSVAFTEAYPQCRTLQRMGNSLSSRFPGEANVQRRRQIDCFVHLAAQIRRQFPSFRKFYRFLNGQYFGFRLPTPQ